MRPLRSATRNSFVLFAGCLAFHFLGTWSLPLIDRDEPRFAEASREMLQRGDYVVPFFNNVYRFDKPPLTYWLQVASYRAFGENDFAARFPSAIAAALTAVLLLNWGRRMTSESVGLSAAIIFTLCLQTFLHAKAAVADMWLVFFVTAAHYAGWQLFSQTKERRWWWMFYISLAFAFLAKGPIGWTPLVALVVLKFVVADVAIARNFKPVRGIILMLAIVCAWGIPALLQTHGDFFRVGIGHHVIERSVATMEGHGAASPLMYLALLPYYFVTVFVSFFPWSIKLPSLASRLWRERDPADVFLITTTLVIFIAFTLVRTKLPHYTLPAFPLLALLLARHLSFTFVKRTAIMAAVIYVAVALVAPPLVARQFPAATLFHDAEKDLKPDTEFALVEFNEPSVVWYFRSHLTGFIRTLRPREVEAFMQSGGPRALLLPSKLLSEKFPALPGGLKVYSTHGFNIPKGKAVDLTLLIKPE